ncbi:hypothetical protein [Paraprevotella clara]|jgi:hypothetical protein|uniref:hypothetical protein n=1 Tax=Paraprevotella clara TaxID=454154 RepID=UPI00307C1F1C
MKNSLLTAIALCCATSSTMPLWASAYENPKLETIEPNLATNGTGGGVYYVYHVATNKFLTNGNDYNTRLSVGDTGQEVTLSYGEERAPLMGKEPVVPGQGWTFNMLKAQSNSGFHEVYAGSETGAWVDCNEQGHTLWQILPQGNGYYRIKIVDQDAQYGLSSANALTMNGMWGTDGVESTIVYPFIDPSQEGYQNAETDWQFVEPEAYEIYQAKKLLLQQLETASETGYADVSAYETVYNDDNATTKQVQEAAEQLQQAIADYQLSIVDEEHPADFTGRIQNNAFESNTDHWDINGESVGYQATLYATQDRQYEMKNFVERWVRGGGNLGNSMDVSQTLTDLPAGKYRLSANTIGYQQGDMALTPEGVYIYARVQGAEYKGEAHTLEFGAIRGNDGYVTDAPTPRLATLEFFLAGGNLTVGFKTENTNCNWVCVDNFKLEYLGLEEGGLARQLAQTITDAQTLKKGYDDAQIKYSITNGEKFDQALSLAQQTSGTAGVDEATLGEVLNGLMLAMDTLNLDVAAYEKLEELTGELNEAYDASPYSENGLISYEDFLYELEEIHDNRTFNPLEIDSIQPRADRMFKACVCEALIAGDTQNADGMASNLDFTGSNSGWTKTGDGDFKYGNNVAEVWQGSSFEVYQELTGLPKGSYTISVQAYNRQGLNEDIAAGWNQSDPQKDVLSYLFGNDAKEKVRHLYEFHYASNEDLANNGSQISGTGTAIDGQWVPNGVAGGEAAFAFNDRTDYTTTITCYVGEDGKLRFGITMPTGPNSNNWTLFDNFHIQYLGAADMTGAVSALNAKIAEANAALADKAITTEEAYNALSQAIQDAEKSLESELTEEIYTAQIKALDEAIILNRNSVEKVETLHQTALMYDEQINSGAFADYDEGILANVVYEVLDVFTQNGTFKDIPQTEQYIIEMNEAYNQMVYEGIDVGTASKDTPTDVTDMLINPDFQQVFEEKDSVAFTDAGWTTEFTNGIKEANDSVFEFYNTDTCHIYQKMYRLHPGYYKVTLYGFYRAGEADVAALARREGEEQRNTKVYAETESANYSKPLPSFFECVQNGKFTATDIVLPDSLFPNSGRVYNCVINDRKGARTAMNQGYYEMESYFYVKEGETVRLGVQKTDTLVNDWVLIDDFHLYYLGDGEANRPEGLDDVDISDGISDNVADEKSTVVGTAWYNLNGMRISRPTQRGIYIREDKMSDGTKKTLKVLIK